jgi:hypothetical protein
VTQTGRPVWTTVVYGIQQQYPTFSRPALLVVAILSDPGRP